MGCNPPLDSCCYCTTMAGRWGGLLRHLLVSCLRRAAAGGQVWPTSEDAYVTGRKAPKPVLFEEIGHEVSCCEPFHGKAVCSQSFLESAISYGLMCVSALAVRSNIGKHGLVAVTCCRTSSRKHFAGRLAIRAMTDSFCTVGP